MLSWGLIRGWICTALFRSFWWWSEQVSTSTDNCLTLLRDSDWWGKTCFRLLWFLSWQLCNNSEHRISLSWQTICTSKSTLSLSTLEVLWHLYGFDLGGCGLENVGVESGGECAFVSRYRLYNFTGNILGTVVVLGVWHCWIGRYTRWPFSDSSIDHLWDLILFLFDIFVEDDR